MGKLWNWFQQSQNLAAIAAVAGALAFIWVQVIALMLRPPGQHRLSRCRHPRWSHRLQSLTAVPPSTTKMAA